MKPKRVQRKRERGWRAPKGAVYVGRGTKWGNPWGLGDRVEITSGRGNRQVLYANPELAVILYRLWMINANVFDIPRHPLGFEAVKELAGKDLMCWCPEDQPCHADVLLEIANPKENQ